MSSEKSDLLKILSIAQKTARSIGGDFSRPKALIKIATAQAKGDCAGSAKKTFDMALSEIGRIIVRANQDDSLDSASNLKSLITPILIDIAIAQARSGFDAEFTIQQVLDSAKEIIDDELKAEILVSVTEALAEQENEE